MRPSTPQEERLGSLDAFRGLAIASMILVNNPGDWKHLYPALAHAKWHGWTFTDTVFPFFLFIVGVSMALSTGRHAALGVPRGQLMAGLARRALVVFTLGFALNLIPAFNWSAVRIPGVLQRIALCSLLAAPLVLWAGWRMQVAAVVGLFVVYSAALLGVPVPGPDGVVATGLLEPGRDTGAWIDRALMPGHLWVQSRTWDPEGVLGTLPATGSVLLGALCGRWLGTSVASADKTVWMMLAGLALLGAGTVMDAALMPVNKSLWTPSYAVLMAGWALLVFAAFFWTMDAAPHPRLRAAVTRACRPLVIYGVNALFLFVLSGFIAKMMGFIKIEQADGTRVSLRAWLYAPWRELPLEPVQASLAWAVVFNAVMFGVAWVMWRKRWFIKA